MLRADKDAKLSYYEDKIKEASFIFFANPEGASFQTMSELRQRLSALNASVIHIKNTLARIVFERNSYEQVVEVLNGPSMLVCGSQDVGAVAKIIREFQADSRDRIFLVKGILYDGKFYRKEDFKFFTSLPTDNEARAKLLSIFRSPMRRLCFVLSEPRAKLVRLLKAKAHG